MQYSTAIKKIHPPKPHRIYTRIALSVLIVLASAALYNFSSSSGLTITPLAARIQDWATAFTNPHSITEHQVAQPQMEKPGDASDLLIMKALQSPDITRGRNSLQILPYLDAPHAGGTLARALNSDPDPMVRANAAWVLGEIKNANYLADVEQAAILDQSPQVRETAVAASQAIRLHLAAMANLDAADVGAMAVAPGDSNFIYLTAGRDVIVSHDGGETWQVVKDTLANQVLALAIDPRDPNVVYVGVDRLGIYKSADGGFTWQARNTGLGINPGTRGGVTAIAIDDTNPQRLLVAAGVWRDTRGEQFIPLGIYQSRDEGETWQLRVQSVNKRAINRITLKGDELYGLDGNDVLMMAVY